MRVLHIKIGLVAKLFAVSCVAVFSLSSSAVTREKKAPPPTDPEIFRVVPQTCTPAKGQFVWNFEDEELINILRQVSDLLCKTVVVNDSINKTMKMTIIGKTPLTPKDAWDVLMASLSSKGMALVEQGKTWTIIKRSESKNYSTPFYSKGLEAKNNEEIGTLFYKAEHASPDALKNIGRMLISKDGIIENIGEQHIIVIDSNSNIHRLGSIFAQIDIEDALNKIHVVNLKNADARTVEKQLKDLFDIPASSSRRSRRSSENANKSSVDIDKIIADERTNSVIIVADNDALEKIKPIINMLDVKDDKSSKGSIHVKRLNFADAEKIAETINSVVQGNRKSRFSRSREDGVMELFEGEVKVTAHKDTNTIVTVASPNDYRSMLQTINALDVRKDQVYVEAVILDIAVDDSNKFGVGLFSGVDATVPGVGSSLGMLANPTGAGLLGNMGTTLATAGAATSNIAGLGDKSIGALAMMSNFLSGGVAGFVGPGVAGSSIPSFGAILQAIATNSSVDVLSTPSLLTSDNHEAVMTVGEKIPVIKGASSAGGGLGGLGIPLQNVAYEDVKLSFKITPHVGADNNVRLDIDQEVNELGQDYQLVGTTQKSIKTKTAKTTLVLKDQQTGVIGGLISHRSATTDRKVPILGDIPLLGWLFKNRASENTRRSLALIITPYVIKTDDDYKKILERKLKEREEFAKLYYGGKIKNYNKYIDYDKKPGPLSSTILSIDAEMKKIENGGPGDGNDTVLTPAESKPEEQVPESSTVPMPSLDIEVSGEGARASFDDEEGLDDEFVFDEFQTEPELAPGGPAELLVPESAPSSVVE